MEKAKKCILIIIKVLITILIISASYILIKFFTYHYKTDGFYKSPTSENSIEIQKSPPIGFQLFGPYRVKIIAKSDHRSEKYIFDLADDGSPGFVTVTWISDDEATVLMQGSEQADKTVKITFDDTIKLKQD